MIRKGTLIDLRQSGSQSLRGPLVTDGLQNPWSCFCCNGDAHLKRQVMGIEVLLQSRKASWISGRVNGFSAANLIKTEEL